MRLGPPLYEASSARYPWADVSVRAIFRHGIRAPARTAVGQTAMPRHNALTGDSSAMSKFAGTVPIWGPESFGAFRGLPLCGPS